MKVALVLTGLMRCWEKALPVFKQLVIDRYDADVYIHTWSEVGYYTGKGYLPQENGFVKTVEGERGFHASGELIDANAIMQAYNPVAFAIEDFTKFDARFTAEAERFPNGLTRPKNTLCQAYKAYMGASLLPLNTYDIVVRARPDIVLEHDTGTFLYDTFLTLPSRNSRNQGTGDSIQIGSQADIETYCQMYQHIDELYDELGYSCPHDYAALWIRKHGFNWQEMPVGAHVAHSPRGIYQEPE
jgi:hypothetical protein